MTRIIDSTKKNLIGRRVRELRIAKGMSQQQVSNKLELLAIYVCRGSISRVEDYSRTVTDLELFGFAQVLGVNVADLMETDGIL